jgi:hypothetical protein
MYLGLDTTDLLGPEASLFLSQGFSIILCMTFTLEKRGDIIAASRGINFFRRTLFKFRVLTLAGSEREMVITWRTSYETIRHYRGHL